MSVDMKLSELPLHTSAHVTEVIATSDDDAISRRLQELGFVTGEAVRLIARGPIGAEPLLIQIGFTRFALRITEAARVHVALSPAG